MLGMEQLSLASGCGCCLTGHAAPIAADHVYNLGHSHSTDDQSSPSERQVRSLHPIHADLHPRLPTEPFNPELPTALPLLYSLASVPIGTFRIRFP